MAESRGRLSKDGVLTPFGYPLLRFFGLLEVFSELREYKKGPTRLFYFGDSSDVYHVRHAYQAKKGNALYFLHINHRILMFT